MDAPTKEIIELNHNLNCGKNKYGNLHGDNTLTYKDISYDFEITKIILDNYENTKKLNKIKFNCISYYWGDDLEMTGEILKELKEHSEYKYLDEDAYSVCYMEGELVIY